ncbi:uncharacterized protein LY89DRAFT_679418 [Mollisia scopiformis]|uniref:Uncharacterized protein n=1 Tax=Mollisia scopiformis TaxID=149040 RepID=A0A194XVH4_MOLSC|nr:uncharacterized protein LY89DRAFT_679418 [Mollisia scopiformis]KUJ24228.1 hypothetical protein LY89DRAFT_679418 [Mollisia scopiformis]
MAACLENAAHIGINVYEHIRRPKGHNELTPSPFYQSTFATTSLPQSILTELYDSVKPDLRPCSAQVKQPHPLYIDTLPFPSLRQRVLALRSCVTDLGDAGADGGEKIFDEEDFCRDIDADGIVCWGSDTDIGTGAPWDRRSWECRPWFLRKWWMVTGGPEGELGKQSRWWAEMRGEVFEEV